MAWICGCSPTESRIRPQGGAAHRGRRLPFSPPLALCRPVPPRAAPWERGWHPYPSTLPEPPCGGRVPARAAEPAHDPAKWSEGGETARREERVLPPAAKRRIWRLYRREPGGRKKCGIKRWLHRLSHRPAMRAGDAFFKRRPPLFSTFSKYDVAPLLGSRLLFRLLPSRNPPLFRRFGWL